MKSASGIPLPCEPDGYLRAMHDVQPRALVTACTDDPSWVCRKVLEATADAHTLLARAGGALGSLSDRGLAALPAGAGSLAVDEEGDVHLSPRVLTESDDPSSEPVLQLARELGLNRSERELVADAFVDAHRGSAAERRRLTSELRDG